METAGSSLTMPGERLSRRGFLHAAGLTTLAGVAAACGSSGTGNTVATGAGRASNKALVTVRLTNDFLPDLINAWYWVGKDSGYFTDEGIDLVMQNPPQTQIGDPRLVTTGQADVLMSYIPNMITARAAGLPIISVGVYMKQRADGLIWDPKHITIKGPHDLAGKVYGNFASPDWQAEFRQFLKSAGMTTKDVQIVDPGFSTPTFIQAGKIDAGDGLDYGERVTLGFLSGKPAGFLNFNDFGVPVMPFGEFVVTEDYANKNAETIKGFLRATARSMKKYLTDTQASVAAFKECCISGPTATGTLESTTAKFSASLPYWFDKGADIKTAKYMLNDETQWKDVLAWAPGIGLATTVESATHYFTNQYITPQAQNPTL
jgi:putative hydroxymethylpyrimidine transport system substrate-binding protein